MVVHPPHVALIMPTSQISIDELQVCFTVEKGWRIKEIQTVEFLSRVAPQRTCNLRLH